MEAGEESCSAVGTETVGVGNPHAVAVVAARDASFSHPGVEGCLRHAQRPEQLAGHDVLERTAARLLDDLCQHAVAQVGVEIPLAGRRGHEGIAPDELLAADQGLAPVGIGVVPEVGNPGGVGEEVLDGDRLRRAPETCERSRQERRNRLIRAELTLSREHQGSRGGERLGHRGHRVDRFRSGRDAGLAVGPAESFLPEDLPAAHHTHGKGRDLSLLDPRDELLANSQEIARCRDCGFTGRRRDAEKERHSRQNTRHEGAHASDYEPARAAFRRAWTRGGRRRKPARPVIAPGCPVC